MLALFAERIRPPARALSDPEREQLKALVGRRSQLPQMITAERNRRARRPSETIAGSDRKGEERVGARPIRDPRQLDGLSG
jgi:transposase